MHVLLWSGMFFVLAVYGSAVGLAGMIGMPISTDTNTGVWMLAAAVIVSGIGLLIFAPPVIRPEDEPIDVDL